VIYLSCWAVGSAYRSLRVGNGSQGGRYLDVNRSISQGLMKLDPGSGLLYKLLMCLTIDGECKGNLRVLLCYVRKVYLLVSLSNLNR